MGFEKNFLNKIEDQITLVSEITEGGEPETLKDFLDPSTWDEPSLKKLKVADLRNISIHFGIHQQKKDKKADVIKTLLDYSSPANASIELHNFVKYKSTSKPSWLTDYSDNAGIIDETNNRFYDRWSTRHRWYNYKAKWLCALLHLVVWNSFVLWREHPRKKFTRWMDFEIAAGKELVSSGEHLIDR